MSTPPISPTFQTIQRDLLAITEDDDDALPPSAPEPQAAESKKPADLSTTLAHQFTQQIRDCQSVDAAEKAFQQLKEQKIPIDSYHFNALMHVYVQYQPTKAETIIPRMEDLGITPTRNTYNILIEAYAKCKNLRKAKEIYFDVLPKKKIEPDEVTFNSILKACRNCKEVDLARELYKNSTLKATPVTLHLLVQILCSSSDPEEAFELVKKAKSVVQPLFSTYQALIHHYTDRRIPKRVLEVYQDMPQEITLDGPTYFTVLKSYAMIGDEKSADKIYNILLTRQNCPYIHFLSHEIDALVEAKEIHAAKIIYSLFFRYQASQGHSKERLRCERMSGNVAYLFMQNYLSKKKGKDHFVVFLNKENINQFAPLLREHHQNKLTWEIKRNNNGFEVFIHPL